MKAEKLVPLTLILTAIWCLGPTLLSARGADEERLAELEERLTREVEQLVDATGEISEKDWKKAIEQTHKGVLAHEAGDFEKALQHYDRAIEKVPFLATAYYEKGFTYKAMGDQWRAFEEITRAYLLDPKLEMAHIVRASLLDDMGFNERALTALQTLIEVNPESYLGQLNLGITLLRLNRIDEARVAFERAREIRPDHPAVYLHMATLARHLGEEYEERRYLEAFVERGADDPRLPAVKKRLEELSSHQITLDPDSPYPSMQLTEQMARTLWQSEKHKMTFPDARGYFPSYEEEHDVLADLLLPQWRSIKEDDPEAAHGRYDMLLAIDDAGFLDEYIWYVNQKSFGEPAATWLAEHEERIGAFLAWAGEAGYLASEEEQEAPAEDEEPGLPAMVFMAAEQSALAYNLGPLGKGDAEKYIERESRRYRKHLDLDGEDQVTPKQAREILAAPQALTNPMPLLAVLRSHLPDDEEWQRAIGLHGSFGLAYRDLAPPRPLPLNIDRSGDTVTVGLDMTSLSGWMVYALAKAVFRHEAELRSSIGGPAGDDPTVLEEVFAWATLIEGYVNSLESDPDAEEESEPAEPDPYFDQLLEITRSDNLQGFVLFEVIHKTYGVPLDRLTGQQVEELQGYLQRYVFIPISPSSAR
jgi:cytochrome c-type biogenesis protein CcmH/NrfG